eukprot:TRINITY_DN8_c0_g1_i1.p2 TRINITY_DN8_c0_g1~~TRINITY_DN8_c0_g1_i1.p2  ORF type:complete len:127 (-),score=99.89 TRINITY_DN8_c0_g1_i1:52-432(-)
MLRKVLDLGDGGGIDENGVVTVGDGANARDVVELLASFEAVDSIKPVSVRSHLNMVDDAAALDADAGEAGSSDSTTALIILLGVLGGLLLLGAIAALVMLLASKTRRRSDMEEFSMRDSFNDLEYD